MEGSTERRRWPRLLGGALLMLALALAGLWLVRKPLATRYADRFLAAKGVPARYRIVDLGFGRQRLMNVVLGDPARPDLVADWLEARTAYGLGGPYLTGVRAGHVRLRARLVNGRLSFGSIDRLLPPPGGKGFALPALDVDVEDARVRLETPFGLAGLKIVGAGRLDGGFRGRIAATAPALGAAGCAGQGVGAFMRVDLGRRRWTVRGPAQAATLICRGARVSAPRMVLAFQADPSLAEWGGHARLAAATLLLDAARAERLTAAVDFRRRGGAAQVSGGMDLAFGAFAARRATGGATRLAGRYRFDWGGAAGPALSGYGASDDGPSGMRLTVSALRVPAPSLPTSSLAGTPLAPLAGRLSAAIGAAAGSIDLDAGVTAELRRGEQAMTLHRLDARSRSGARVALAPGGEIGWRAGAGGPMVTARGLVTTAGGGLPDLNVRLSQAEAGMPIEATLTMRRYAAGSASLALAGTAARWTPGGGTVALRTAAILSGPLGEGRVDGLTLPIDARWARGRLILGQGCAPVRWAGLDVSGLSLDAGGVRLCPTAGALVSVADGRVAGGVSIGATRLTGRLGTSPLTLSATGARVRLADRGFALQGVAARLGQPGRVTRLDIVSLQGRAGPDGLAGGFAGAGGRIGAVPLVLSEAAGSWRLSGGALSLSGGLTVSDAQADRPRFRPMPVRGVSLALNAGAITADGTVVAPGASGRKVADVRLTHVLQTGAGAATFTVPGLRFDRALQPEQLTPVTFGVIADVQGAVTGEGRIAWSGAGVTSTGTFRTDHIDLAAAFGPVHGIAGTIRFDDLLALRSAPGQQVTVREVNPGIPVTDGVVRFQTLPDARVRVEGARWPFAGGTLTLEPALLDFGAAAERRMTFRVDGMQADRFLQQFDFKNLDATGTFDGVLPMVFDQTGGRIENGRLVVRPGGGQIAYVGPLGQKDIGFWPNLAFQALKSLRYRSLTIGMDGPLAGEMVTEVRFAGISQGEGAKKTGVAGLLVRRLQRLPFVFNIRIRAPFRGLLDATASFYDPKRLVQRNLPQLLEEQDKRSRPIQPPASEKVP